MTRKQFIISLSFVFSLSLLAWAVWIFEILYFPGWYGLNWLFVTLYSPYISTFIAALAFAVPFMVCRQGKTKNIFFSVLLFYLVNLICFQVGKMVNFSLHSWFISGSEALLLFSMVILLFPFLSFTYWLITQLLIRKSKESAILIILFPALATFPFSSFTINLNSGFGTGTTWVDSVKMGYPIFWMTFFMGCSGIIIAKQKNQSTSA
jgi:hypothetical protein